jgi:hypothetical protein
MADGRGCHGDGDGEYLCINPGKASEPPPTSSRRTLLDFDSIFFWAVVALPFGRIPSLTHSPFLLLAMEVANLEAAFERVTVTDENEEQISSSTTSYHKTKVLASFYSVSDEQWIDLQRRLWQTLHR